MDIEVVDLFNGDNEMENTILAKAQNKLAEIQNDLDAINRRIEALRAQIVIKESEVDNMNFIADKFHEVYYLLLCKIPSLESALNEIRRFQNEAEDQDINLMNWITQVDQIISAAITSHHAAYDFEKKFKEKAEKEESTLETLLHEKKVLLHEEERLFITQRMLLICEELFTE